MSARAVAAFLVLPLLVGLERLAYYGHRSVLFLHLQSTESGGLGLENTLAFERYQQFTLYLSLSLVFGGGLAALATPRVSLVVGAVVTTLGYFLLMGTGAEQVLLVFGVIALGQGAFKPGLWAAAGDEISHLDENFRNLLFVIVYAAVNLGALLASPLGAGMESATGDRRLLFGVAGGLMILVTLLAIGLLVLHLLGPRLPPRSAPWKVLPGAAVVFVLAAPAQLLMGQLFELQFRALRPFETLDLQTWVNPAAVLATCGLLAALLLVTGLLGFRLRSAVLIGTGSLLLGLSALPYLGPLLTGALSVEMSEPVLPESAIALTMVVAAIGEVLLGLTVARLVTGTNARVAGALVALWFFLSWAGYLLPSIPSESQLLPLLVTALTVAAAFGGLALLGLNGVLQRSFFEPAESVAPTKAAAVDLLQGPLG